MFVRATIQYKTMSIHKYIRKMDPWDELLSECLRQLRKDRDEEEK